jgi:hypothetical protein
MVSPAADLAMSWINPFERSSCIPDGSNGTGCFSLKQQFLLGTGTNGTSNILALCPNINALYYQGGNTPTATTPVVTGNWSAALSLASVQTMYQSTRPVSLGLRATYVGNTQTDGGILLVGQVAANFALSDLNGASLTAAAYQFQYYKIYPLRNGCEVTWRPEEQEDMEWTSSGTETVATSAGQIVPTIVMAIYGCNSATASLVEVEAVSNFEGEYVNQNFLPGGINALTNRSTIEPGWYEKAKQFVSAIEPVVPMILGAASSSSDPRVSALGKLGTLANGYLSPGTLGTSSMGVYNLSEREIRQMMK